MAIDPDSLESFRYESLDLIDDIELRLVAMAEASSEGLDCIEKDVDAILNALDTLKDIAVYVGLELIPNLIAETEAVLKRHRHDCTPDYCEVLCESVCFLRETIEVLREGVSESSYEKGFFAVIKKCQNIRREQSTARHHSESASHAAKEDLSVSQADEEELIAQFISEGDQFLSNIKIALSSLLQNNQQPAIAGDVYRQMHSFKGNCSLMNYPDLERLSIAMEMSLGLYKSGKHLMEKKFLKCCLSQMEDLQFGLDRMKKGHDPTIENLDKKIGKITASIPSSHIQKQHLCTLPAAEKDEKSVLSTRCDLEESAPLKVSTICVVEDSVLSRKKIKSLLKSQKYEVLEACDGVEAMEIIRSGQQKIDLVITDLGMPRMDGHDLVKAINTEFNETPILILSGADDVDILQKLIGQELNGYIQKNTPRVELFSIVKRSLSGEKKKKLLSNVIERMKEIGSIIKAKKEIHIDVEKLDSMINIVDELIEAESEENTDPDEAKRNDGFVEDRAERLKSLIGDMVSSEKDEKDQTGDVISSGKCENG